MTSIRCVQNDFRAYGMFDANSAPILHQDLHYHRKDRNELQREPRHLVVPSGASKKISEHMVHLAQTMHLSCTDANTVCSTKTVHLSCVNISTIFKRTELSLERCHLGVPSGVSKTIYELMVHLAETVHLS
jgi:hypothetical protein